MVEVENSEVINQLSEDAKISPSTSIGKSLSNNIQPVLIANPTPKNITGGETLQTTTGSHAVFTTPANIDFYVSSVQLGYTCSAAADSTDYRMNLPFKNTSSKRVLGLQKQTLTASSDHAEMTFNPPLLLERNSTCTVTQAFTVGASTVAGVIIGFTKETLKTS